MSNLTSGIYKFQLTVTDTIGQSDSTKVTVLVLTPEQSDREYLRNKLNIFIYTGLLFYSFLSVLSSFSSNAGQNFASISHYKAELVNEVYLSELAAAVLLVSVQT